MVHINLYASTTPVRSSIIEFEGPADIALLVLDTHTSLLIPALKASVTVHTWSITSTHNLYPSIIDSIIEFEGPADNYLSPRHTQAF